MSKPALPNLQTELREISRKHATEIVLSYVLTKQLLDITEAAKNNLMEKENREKWKSSIIAFEDSLVNFWCNLPEDHEFKKIQKIVHTGKVGTPYEEIQKGRLLFQACMKLAKPLLPPERRIYETIEEIPEDGNNKEVEDGGADDLHQAVG